MEKTQNYQGGHLKRLILCRSVLLLALIFCATGIFAQNGRLVLEKNNARIYQQADGWKMYHGTEIVAHGEGSINVGNMPPMFKKIFESIANTGSNTKLGKNLSKAVSTPYGPYLKTAWNQQSPYNDVFPLLTYTDSEGKTVTGRTVTGCSTISTGQVLNYYGYCLPINASGNRSCGGPLSTDNDFYSITNLQKQENTYNGEAYTYYTYDYDVSYTPDFAKIASDNTEMSKFLLAISMAQSAGYGTSAQGGTATNATVQAEALTDIFGYNVTRYSNLTSLEYEQFAEKALHQAHPLIISGGGHSFIIDGFNGQEYHIDYGWGGAGNCWLTAEAFAKTSYGNNFGVTIASPKIAVDMQATPKYLHITGNGTDKKLDMKLTSGLDYAAEVQLAPGTYEFSIEYADGTLIAPYTTQVLQLNPDKAKYELAGMFVQTPAQLQVLNTHKVKISHNIGTASISVEATDLQISISGKVYDSNNNALANAIVTTSPTKPVQNTLSREKGGYYWKLSSRHFIEFVPNDAYISQVGVYMYCYGNKNSDVILELLDESKNTIWETSLTPAQIVFNTGWTEVSTGATVKVTPGKKHYIALSHATVPSTSEDMYGYSTNLDNEPAYKVTTVDAPMSVTDQNGNYSLSTYNPFNGAIFAYADDLTYAPAILTDVAADKTSVDFKPGSATTSTVSGKVLDQDSNPIPYATVSLTTDQAEGKTVKADFDGEYTIQVTKNFTGTLYAFADGYNIPSLSLSKITGNVTGKDFKGTSAYITVTGKILGIDNAGIANALVSLSADMSNAIKTTADGSYTIDVAKNSTAKLYATADGCDFSPATVTTKSAEIAGLDIQELPKNVTISGKVLDKDNKAVPDVWITTENKKPEETADVSLTSSSYKYIFHTNSLTTRFTPTKSYITRIELKIRYSGKPDDLTIAINDNKGNAVWQTIVKPDDTYFTSQALNVIEVGVPVTPGEKYSIVSKYNYNSNVNYYAYYGDDNYSLIHTIYAIDNAIRTNSNGEYSIQVRRHSDLTLYAWAGADYEPLTITDASELTGQDFKPKQAQPKTYTIAGKITDENSKAISGAKVSLSATSADTQTVTSASDGSYSFTVTEGFTGKIAVQYSGYTFTETTISSVTADIANKNIKGTKIIVNYTVSGKVTDEKSKAISGATITITSSDGSTQTATTDKNGAYSFTVTEGFTGIITAEYDGYKFSTLTLNKVSKDLTSNNFAGEKIIVYATISGTVKDQANTAIPGASVSINQDMTDAVTTGTDGAYSIQVSDNFSGKIYTKADGYEFEPLTIKNATGSLANQNITGKEIIDENATVYITGRVLDKSYNPVEGAEVYTTTDGVPELKLDCNKEDDAGNCYYLPNSAYASNYSYSAFTPKNGNIGRVEFKVFYNGKPGSLSVAILDSKKAVVAEKSLESSQVKNNDWTAADLDATVTPGQQYYIVIKSDKARSGSNYYAYYDSKDDDGMLFRIHAYEGGETKKSVKTAYDGSFTFEAAAGENVKLYASYATLVYEPKTFSQLKYDVPGQDFVPEGAVAPTNTVTISGTVYDITRKGISGAIVTPSSKAPYVLCKQDDCTTCWSFTEQDVPFKATDKYITQVDFMISKTNTPGNLTVSILDASKRELWSKTFTNDETTAWQWKEVFIDNSVQLIPGEYYNIRLTAQNTGGTYFYVMNDKYEMAYRVWANDEPCVRSNSNGAYSFTVNANTSGSLHAYYDDITFNTVEYANLTQNATGKDFGIFTSVGVLREKGVSTPVSEVVPSSKTNTAKVWSYDKTIYIETLAGSQYRILDLNGRIITTSTTASTREQVNIGQSGIYIVHVNNQAYKVMVH